MDGINVVELLDGNLDLGLGGAALNNEDEGVVVLDLLHGSLCMQVRTHTGAFYLHTSCQGVLDEGVLVKSSLTNDSLAGVQGLAGKSEGLRAVIARGEFANHRFEVR